MPVCGGVLRGGGQGRPPRGGGGGGSEEVEDDAPPFRVLLLPGGIGLWRLNARMWQGRPGRARQEEG